VLCKSRTKRKEDADIIHELSELIYRALDLFDVLVTFLYFSECSSSIAVSCRVQKLEKRLISNIVYEFGRKMFKTDSLREDLPASVVVDSGPYFVVGSVGFHWITNRNKRKFRENDTFRSDVPILY
jgi:hypothetical protein